MSQKGEAMGTDASPAIRRTLLAALAILTLAGQILEAERAPRTPALTMTLRDRRVVAIQPGGAAARAGIEVGDRLLAVDGEPVPPGARALPLLRRHDQGDSVPLAVLRDGQQRAVDLPLPPAPSGEIAWRLALAAVGILTLLTGLLVYLRKPRAITLIFAGLCYGLGFLIHPPYIPPIPWMHWVGETLLSALTFLIPSLFVHLFLLFPVRRPWIEPRRRALLLYLPGLLLLALSLLRPHVQRGGPLGPLLAQLPQVGATLLWVAGIVAAVALFVNSYRRARTGTARRQLRVILWGTALGVLPLVLALLLRQLWPGLPISADRATVLFTLLVPLSFAYAIVRHGVFDSTLIVRRSLALSALGLLLVATYFGVSLLLRSLAAPADGRASEWITLASMVAALILLAPASQQIRALLDHAVESERPSSRSLLAELGEALRGVESYGHRVRTISDFIAEALGAQRLAFCEREEDGRLALTYLYGLLPGELGRYRFSRSLSRRMQQIATPIERGDLEIDLPYGYIAPTDQAILDLIAVRILAPLRAGDRQLGLLLIGRSLLGTAHGAEDLRLAATLAAEGGIALENAQLLARARAEEQLRAEVHVARDLQRRMLPAQMPQVESLEMSGFSLPCAGVGGDCYDCFRTPSGDVLLAIGDVSGKGVPGALLMANLQGLVKTEGRRAESPWQIVERINRRLCEMRKPERFVTFCLARIDPLTGALAYCNAGHPFPIVVRGDGRIEELGRGGLPLGIRPAARYDGGQTILGSGDLLVLYTDGITERHAGEEEFGVERLRALLRRGRRSSAPALQAQILAAVRHFSNDPPEDDTTLLVVKLL
ncbi:MAG: SpoIIE family protein phosphatase [Candidatus Eisenbacteria bacterium]|nr:SpoIIE family protein phosphatase [Candidatus Eisenbacteria bacterium]